MSMNPERLTRLTKDVLDGTMQDLYIEGSNGIQIHPNYVNPNRLDSVLTQAIDPPWHTRIAVLAAHTLRWVCSNDHAQCEYDPDEVVPRLYDIKGEHITFGDLDVSSSTRILKRIGFVEVGEEGQIRPTTKSQKIISRHPEQVPTVLPPKGWLFHGLTRAARVNRLYTTLIFGEEAYLQKGKATIASETYVRRRNMHIAPTGQDDE